MAPSSASEYFPGEQEVQDGEFEGDVFPAGQRVQLWAGTVE